MYLKGMQIQGFKSFADKVSLEFTGGITSVIGPNGSGKSNIADAVRWVLGEQSAKTLRGGKMEDVIFAGTEHRKPMGFSEVSLSIDNSDKKLPVDFSEVTITRRIFRSGESEYLLNKTACRLKDINELLMDTGLGKDGYSIIGQGKVDEILSTKSEDRRLIFEEASGIMKYKVRKLESEKKLELTRQNLLRINDIISELEVQIEPLRNQSEAAKKFLSLREQLKTLEVNLFIDNIASYKEKMKEIEETLILVQGDIEAENAKQVSLLEKQARQNEELKALEGEHDTAKQSFYECESSIEAKTQEIKFNQERRKLIEASIAKLEIEDKEHENKAEILKKEEGAKQKKLGYLNKQREDFKQKLEEFQKDLDILLEKLSKDEREIELLKSQIMDNLDFQSDKKTQLNNVKHHIESIDGRAKSIDNEIYHLKLESDKDSFSLEETESTLKQVLAQIKEASLRQEKLEAEKSELTGKRQESDKRLNELRGNIQVQSSKQRALENMENSLEGYARSVKELLAACKNSPALGRGIHGALAQLINVDRKYELAVEMALGGALQNIVTDTEEDAKRAIEFLKEKRAGRATFLPISSVNGKRLDDGTLRALSQQEGFVGIAADLVNADPKLSGIILNILGRVVVVRDIDCGIHIARKHNYSFRIVTLDGDILNTGGSMAGGSVDHRQGSILSRQREIADIKTLLEQFKKEEQNQNENIKSLDEMLSEVAKESAEEFDRIRGFEMNKIQLEGRISQARSSIERINAKMQMLSDEKQQMLNKKGDLNIELGKYDEELKKLEADTAEAKEKVVKYQETHKENQTERDNLHADITNYRLSVNSIEESIGSINEDLERISRDLHDLDRNNSNRDKEREGFNKELNSLQERDDIILNETEKLKSARFELEANINNIAEKRKLIENEQGKLQERINECGSTLERLKEEASKLEVRKAKHEADLDSVSNRLWEEYELTFTNALEYKKDLGSLQLVQRNINDLKNQIKDLGPVNVSAIDEYIKVKERFEFMSGQKLDMVQTEEKLKKVIAEITTHMKDQFLEQFRLINANFNIVFRELFEGGRASLVLVDEENVLESGIEIEVQPPGKKLQNMMLLSGGERAFTAIALLFSILKLRPTPFCILDEIEAALDDANVNRFAQYLRNFSENTQFIVVTHRKGTMESSDALYGVTMQEHGVSNIVSLKLESA